MTLAVALLLLVPLAPGQTSLRLGDDGFRVGDSFDEAVPSPDGRFFGVSASNGFHVVEAATGQAVQSWSGGPWVRRLALDRSGHIVVFDADDYLGVYDIDTGRCLRRVYLDIRDEYLPDAEFLCHGRLLRLGEHRSLVPDRVFSTKGMRIEWASLVVDELEQEGTVRTALSPDGRRRAVFVHQEIPPALVFHF